MEACLPLPQQKLGASVDIATDDLSEMEREHIMRVLRETNGVLSGADGAAAVSRSNERRCNRCLRDSGSKLNISGAETESNS